MKSEITLRQAVDTIKSAIFRSQLQALRKANAEQLSLYYGIGKYVSENSRKGFWGTGALEIISQQLRKEIPGLIGFSYENMKLMRRFYEQWSSAFKSVATATEINTAILLPDNQHRPSIDMDEFLSLGFSHHMEIIHKTKTVKERVFYIHHSVREKWNKYDLRARLKEDYYHKHQQHAANNFALTMPDAKQSLRAIEMFKDEYLLAFIGNQYHLEKYGVEQFPDLLFFNREINALVCCELKYGDFKTAYLGQLAGYLRILDDQIKKPHENPSIGILLCKSTNKDFVEFVIRDYTHPMGVATYKTADDLPEELRRSLPPLDELKKLL